jgi:hypothetical protein
MKTLHRVMLIAETPNKHHLTDMTVNRVFSIEVRICVFIFSIKDLYFILFLLTHHPSFLFIFAAPPHLSGNISNVDEILGLFDSPPRAGNNADEHPREPKHTVAKRRASSISPSPHHFDVSSFFYTQVAIPSQFLKESHCTES